VKTATITIAKYRIVKPAESLSSQSNVIVVGLRGS
jgi:hypothetical protein